LDEGGGREGPGSGEAEGEEEERVGEWAIRRGCGLGEAAVSSVVMGRRGDAGVEEVAEVGLEEERW